MLLTVVGSGSTSVLGEETGPKSGGVKIALAWLLQELSLLHLDDACLGEPRREPVAGVSRDRAGSRAAGRVGRVAASPLFALPSCSGQGSQVAMPSRILFGCIAHAHRWIVVGRCTDGPRFGLCGLRRLPRSA